MSQIKGVDDIVYNSLYRITGFYTVPRIIQAVELGEDNIVFIPCAGGQHLPVKKDGLDELLDNGTITLELVELWGVQDDKGGSGSDSSEHPSEG